MMAARCQIAGEKIYRTVRGVEGSFVMKVQPERSTANERFGLTDPYGNDVCGGGDISSFLTSSFREPKPEEMESERAKSSRCVEAEGPVDG